MPAIISIGGRLGYEDAGNTPNTLVTLHNYAAAPILFETRGLPRSKQAQADWDKEMDNFRGSRVGVIVQCENGHVFAPSDYTHAIAYSNDGEVIERWESEVNHFQNFLVAVESRKPEDLNAEILEGHLSSALCHTGNISYELGNKQTAGDIKAIVERNDLLADSVDRMLQHLKSNGVDVDQPVVTAGPWLTMDPATEQFTNSTEATALLRRQCRQGFVVPEIV